IMKERVTTYTRYHIPARPTANIAPHPSRFQVRVNRLQLARLLLTEFLHYRANMSVVLSRPCVYGVFSGPIGGFAPNSRRCVGCLRCTVQYPEIVQIYPNPDRLRLGDSYFTPDLVDTVLYEAATGRVPVRGAGYRGGYGGQGWDGMWTDMSEIVRPTRDGIHGREFISTSVDLGEKPAFLTIDPSGKPVGEAPRTISLPIPFLFDLPPASAESDTLYRALVAAAEGIQGLAIVPLHRVLELGLASPAVIPLVSSSEIDDLERLPAKPRLIELDGWEETAYRALRQRHPETPVCVRLPFSGETRPEETGFLPRRPGVLSLAQQGLRLFHLTANYHGQAGNAFVLDAIRSVHEMLVAEGLREQTTLIGSGGIIAAEHVPKAIICGLDAVALDTSPLIALQGRFHGGCIERASAAVELPAFEPAWAAQRLMNLAAAWRDQLLEILGAMGMREVRRLRGEIGRAMFQVDLEREAFAGIEGYDG
ncbi:MAG: glutamate synthase-related protein, partial [Solimonas sp.]